MIAAYRALDKTVGKNQMRAVIDAVSDSVPAALTEIRRLGRILKHRANDVLAYFDRPGTSNGPTEAINGRLEHLRGAWESVQLKAFLHVVQRHHRQRA